MNQTATAKKFEIKTEVFEGPLELLLDLVEKRKLLINDISLAEVTDEYLKQVSVMQELSLPNTTNFVALAATLLLIKSKSLLPVLELTEDEEDSIEELAERLKLYKIYREAAKTLTEQFGQHVMHERQYVTHKEPLFAPDTFCTPDELRSAMSRVLFALPKQEEKPKVRVKKVISLEEMMDRLHERIENQMNLRFSELINNEKERATMIVGFLAILESVKQGQVLVEQLEHFADIEIAREGNAALPRYQ